MTQKITITLSTLAIAAGSLGMPFQVSAEENNLIYDAGNLFRPTRVEPRFENIDGMFNLDGVPDVKLKQGVYIAYDETRFSQRYVEEHLFEYVNNPEAEWVKDKLILQSWAGFGVTITASSSADKEFISKYRPGLVYYLMETVWQDNPGESKWYWGKIDYRRCAATLGEAGIEFGGICVSETTEDGGWRLRRIGKSVDPGENYVAWAEELQDELDQSLVTLEGEVEAWNGNSEERQGILAQLKQERMRAEDATETIILQEKIDRLIAALGEDDVDEGDTGDNGDAGVGDGGDDNVGTGEGAGSTDGSGDSSDSSDFGGSNNSDNLGSSGSLESGTGGSGIDDDNSGVGAGGGENGSVLAHPGSVQLYPNTTNAIQTELVTDNMQVGQSLAIASRAEATETDQRSVSGSGLANDVEGDLTEGAVAKDESDLNMVAVPALSEEKPVPLYKKWLLWSGIGFVILALAALGVWLWRRSAHLRG